MQGHVGFSGLANLQALRSLSLSATGLKDAEQFSKLGSLEALSIGSHLKLKRLRARNIPPNLKMLRIENNDGLGDIDFRSAISHIKIQELEILNNIFLIRITGLSRLEHLERLSVVGSYSLLELNGLDRAAMLKFLALHHNSDKLLIPPLAQLMDLHQLALSGEPIERLAEEIAKLPKLQRLLLPENASLRDRLQSKLKSREEEGLPSLSVQHLRAAPNKWYEVTSAWPRP